MDTGDISGTSAVHRSWTLSFGSSEDVSGAFLSCPTQKEDKPQRKVHPPPPPPGPSSPDALRSSTASTATISDVDIEVHRQVEADVKRRQVEVKQAANVQVKPRADKERLPPSSAELPPKCGSGVGRREKRPSNGLMDLHLPPTPKPRQFEDKQLVKLDTFELLREADLQEALCPRNRRAHGVDPGSRGSEEEGPKSPRGHVGSLWTTGAAAAAAAVVLVLTCVCVHSCLRRKTWTPPSSCSSRSL